MHDHGGQLKFLIWFKNNIVRIQAEMTEEQIVYTDPKNYITHSVIEEGLGMDIVLERILLML